MKKFVTNVITTILVISLFTACNGNSGHDTIIEVPPEPTDEDTALWWLSQILNSDEGHAMSAGQLATLHEENTNRSVAFTVNKSDVLPRMGVYRHEATDGTIVFKPYSNDKDTVMPVCQADFRIAVYDYETTAHDSASTMCIQNRGKGILAIYHNIVNHRRHDGQHDDESRADVKPEYMGALMYVYPGADSLIITWGYEASKRVYHYVNNPQGTHE